MPAYPFFTPSRAELVAFLIGKRNLSEQDALYLAKRSQGSVSLALDLDLQALDQEDARYFQMLQPEVLKSPSKLFELSEEMSRDADPFRRTIEWMTSCLRDMILWKACGDSEQLIFDRHLAKIRESSARFSFDQLCQAFTRFQEGERLVSRNINRTLTLETILLDLNPAEPNGSAARKHGT